MKYFFLPAILIAILFFPVAVFGLDFTVDDFDPALAADPDNPDAPTPAEIYGMAVDDLIEELTIVATDDEGNELFRVLPFPIELIALMTQAEIHFSQITDPDELAMLVDEANMRKPAANSFTFILDGDPEWVQRDVSVYYIPDVDTMAGVMIPLYKVPPDPNVEYSDEDLSFSEWALVAENMDELTAFLLAPQVMIVIGDADETIDPVILDCSFWRQWGLFDLRMEDPPETEPQS